MDLVKNILFIIISSIATTLLSVIIFLSNDEKLVGISLVLFSLIQLLTGIKLGHEGILK